MAFQDGVGVGDLGRVDGFGTAVVGDQVTAPYSPPDGSHFATMTVWLTVLLATSGTLNSDIQWQVSDDPTFTTTDWTLTSTNKADGFITVATSPLVDGTKYYWRTRSAETGTTGWATWSAVWAVTPDSRYGKAAAYVDLNVGADFILDPDVTAAAYVDLNVGADFILDPDAAEYVIGNVGVEITRKSAAVDYVNEGDVNTATPSPHIWFLRPTSGRDGDGVQVFGFGFGDLPSTYAGELQYKPDPSSDDWAALGVVDWQTYPETADAYGPDRELNQELGTIDMQHTVIEFTIPPSMDPPGHPVRVVTDGP